MVKVGFICEGYTELFILLSQKFKEFLGSIDVESVGEINVEGSKNLLPHNIEPIRQGLLDLGAEKIIILTDLDNDLCITKTKERILKTEGKILEVENQEIIIAVKQIEAWFLADTETLSAVFKQPFSLDFPENEIVPFETIRSSYFQIHKRGIVDEQGKKRLAKKFIDNGFSIESAAKHPNCSSAKYFLNKLRIINQNSPIGV